MARMLSWQIELLVESALLGGLESMELGGQPPVRRVYVRVEPSSYSWGLMPHVEYSHSQLINTSSSDPCME